MEEKIKEIVSTYIKVPADQIGVATPIGRAALGSSILLHRMYARLGEAGVVVTDYAGINVFGDLMRRQGAVAGQDAVVGAQDGAAEGRSFPFVAVRPAQEPGGPEDTGIGIDIEEVAALPRVADLRKEAFYIHNFTPSEIAYCILQADPYASLTGLFAAKEAIVKADGQLRNRPFHTLEIGHSAAGKPEFPGFGLSVSHAGGMAVAVAIRGAFGAAPSSPAPAGKPAGFTVWIAWMALLLAAAALLLASKH